MRHIKEPAIAATPDVNDEKKKVAIDEIFELRKYLPNEKHFTLLWDYLMILGLHFITKFT